MSEGYKDSFSIGTREKLSAIVPTIVATEKLVLLKMNNANFRY